MTPAEALAQRRDALVRANEVRCHRSKVKEDIFTTRRFPDEVLMSDDPLLAGMTVRELLSAVPGIGSSRIRWMLGRGQVQAACPLERLTARQRGYLLVQLRRHRTVSQVFARKMRELAGEVRV